MKISCIYMQIVLGGNTLHDVISRRQKVFVALCFHTDHKICSGHRIGRKFM